MTATQVTRTLKLAEPAGAEPLAWLAAMPGVVSVVPSADGTRLAVTYDVRRTVMDALVLAAASVGLRLSSALPARLARAWAGFQDDNLRSQAKLEHHCCSAPPPADK